MSFPSISAIYQWSIYLSAVFFSLHMLASVTTFALSSFYSTFGPLCTISAAATTLPCQIIDSVSKIPGVSSNFQLSEQLHRIESLFTKSIESRQLNRAPSIDFSDWASLDRLSTAISSTNFTLRDELRDSVQNATRSFENLYSVSQSLQVALDTSCDLAILGKERALISRRTSWSCTFSSPHCSSFTDDVGEQYVEAVTMSVISAISAADMTLSARDKAAESLEVARSVLAKELNLVREARDTEIFGYYTRIFGLGLRSPKTRHVLAILNRTDSALNMASLSITTYGAHLHSVRSATLEINQLISRGHIGPSTLFETWKLVCKITN